MPDNTPKWQKICVAGTFKGHPSGPFSMNADTFNQIKNTFDRDGIKKPFDYEHASEVSVADSDAKSRGAAVAAGWIEKLSVRPDGLYGLVEWTESARQKIKNGEFKYVSPAIRFSARDPKTGVDIGAKLTSCALTLKPFLSDLPEVQASDASGAFLCSEVNGAELVQLTASGGYAMSQNQFLPAFRRMLGLDDMADPETMLDKVDRLSELCDMADGDPCAVVQGINLSNYIPQLRDFMRMPANTTLADMLDAVAEMIGSALEDSQGADMADILSAEAPTIVTVTEETSPAPVIVEETINTMSDTTITLADHTVKLSDAVANAIAPLTLQLKDAEAKVAAAVADATAAAAKVVELTDQIKSRDAAVSASRVEDAFDTYKDTKKLSDDDKAAMSITLSANPELFEKLYPKVKADKKVLLSANLSADRSGAASAVSAKVVPPISRLLADIAAKNPTLDYDAQFTLALEERAKLMAV